MNDAADVPAPAPGDTPFDDIPLALPATEPPLDVVPALPPPNLGLAILWVATFVLAPIVGGIAIGIGLRSLGVQPTLVLLYSVLITFNLLLSLTIVGSQLRQEARPALGLRSFRPLHLVFVVALALPLAVTVLMSAGLVSRALTELLRVILSPEMAERVNRFLSPEHKEVMQAARDNFWLTILFVGFVTGVAEEMLFRGFISRGLLARYGLVWGTCITSLLFGIAHLNPVQAFATFLLGVAFQAIFWTTRSLWLPILAHALHNSVVLTLALFAQERQLLSGELILLSPPLAGLLLWMLYATRTEWRMPNGSVWSPGYPSCEMPPKEVAAEPHHRRTQSTQVVLAVFLGVLLYADLAWKMLGLFDK